MPADVDEDGFYVKKEVDPTDPFKLGKSKEQQKLASKFDFL